ncbi:DNA-directed RNA polymerase subunit L [Candidatus Woesearchaeota archaeon]|nr:DNA-directed RNA polymerase subunit L [Candidatus Woesearchaeota archaeon]
MEISVIEDKKSKLVFEVDGMGHTFMNVLKNELWQDKSVKISTYSARHPIISKPKLILETDGKDPREALKAAVSRLKKESEKFKKGIAKEIK